MRTLLRRGLPILALPVLAAAAVAGLLVASHHTDLSTLSPSGPGHDSSAAAQAAQCERGITRRPFTGIAINPGITEHVRSFEAVTRSRRSEEHTSELQSLRHLV